MSADAFQTLFNRWDMEVMQLMLASEKQCNKFHDGIIEYSPITGKWIHCLQAYPWIQQFHENKVAVLNLQAPQHCLSISPNSSPGGT